ncbi:MAG: hypothetical protein ACYDDX_10265 [Acidithiobacillus ferrivorans]
MDFLPRNLVTGAVFGALCLVSLPAFAVLDTPNYSWRLGQSGNVYKVYDPQGPHLSGNINPGSSFVENSASTGVIENIAPSPLTLDGATGEILNGVGLSRGLSVGDLIDGAKALMVPDNPAGVAFLGLTLVGTLALDAYDASPAGSSSPPFTTYDCGSTVITVGGGDEWAPNGYVTGTGPCHSSTGCIVSPAPWSPPWSVVGGAPSCSNGSVPSSPTPTETPAQAIQWAQANPSSFATNVAPTLNGSPADQTALANDLANSNAPLSTPVPYGYTIPSTDATVQGSPTTTSSTDPSTGNTTNTTSTPSYKFTTPTPPNGVQVQKTTQIVTSTCTSAGSCTVTNTTTNTAPATQPKLGSFTAPALSAPTTSAVSPTPFALNLPMPSQSSAVCPSPLSYNAFGTAFTIPLSPLCTLATDVRPYVESLGAVGAGIVIFR